ncbi:hypothetical protein BKA70DRAFT_1259312, partial [Coprinopsis sp. MPI-PUGE-AT-0042]
MAPTTIKGRPSTKGLSSSKKPTPQPPTRDSKAAGVPSRSRYAVDLNLNAHSRTDPTGALSNLMKLVTSLATRIGGCQYKMTSSEHNLFLHLLSILEPFVYQGARSLSMVRNLSSSGRTEISGLSFQPTEILDTILSHLDSKRDLLHLGLCSKRLYDVIFPRHYDYRVVRCKVSALSVWNHLTVHQSLARNVRKLEILDERSKVSPPRFLTGFPTSSPRAVTPRGMGKRDTDFDSTDDQVRAQGIHGKQERYLLNALQQMTELKEFKWSCNHSPISLEKVWGTLMVTCPSVLERMDMSSNLVFAPQVASRNRLAAGDDSTDDDSDDPLHAGLLSPQVKAVSFGSTKNSYGASKAPDLSQIVQMLKGSPNIESLSINYVRPPRSQNGSPTSAVKLGPLLLAISNGTRWNHLSSLNLSGMTSVTPADFTLLLGYHPSIERLYIPDLRSLGRLELPPNSLPRLREVEATTEMLNFILASPCISEDGENVRPLEIVKGFKQLVQQLHSSLPGPLNPDQRLMSHLERHASTIKRVEMTGWHDMDLVRRLAKAVPGVTYLDFGTKLGLVTREASKLGAPVVTNVDEWLDVLEGLTELRALHGVKFFYEVSALSVPCGPTLLAGTTGLASAGAGTSLPADSTSASKLSADQMSLMDRSRIKKNDWTASMLVWRCPKLRRVDYWEPSENKIIVLTRTKVNPSNPSAPSGSKEGGVVDGEGAGAARETVTVKWDVRRVRKDAA